MSETKQSLVVDLGSLTPEVSPSARQALEWTETFATAAGDPFSLNTLTIFSTAADASTTEAVLETLDLVVAIDPETHFMIYQGPGSAFDTEWYDALIAEMQEMRPSLSVSLLAAGPIFDEVVADPAFAEIARDEVSDAVLAGMVIYTQVFEKPAPIDIEWPDTLDPSFVAALPALSQIIEGSVLGKDNSPTELLGTVEDDTLILTASVENVVGSDGTDTLVIGRGVGDVQITELGGGVLSLDILGGTSVNAQGVERLEFLEATLAFDVDGTAGQAYRLYQAVFDRLPDIEGLGFWIDQLDTETVTLTEAAALFITSEEFAENYGTPETVSDEAYLTLLYENVLDREPDEAGFDFWRDRQDSGLSRAEMLVYFSESIENKILVGPTIDDGIWYV